MTESSDTRDELGKEELRHLAHLEAMMEPCE